MEKAAALEEGSSQPGPSQENTSDTEERDEQSKGELTNALKYSESLLRNLNLLTDTPPTVISAASIAMGEIIGREIVDMVADGKIINVEELIGIDEFDELQEYSPVS